MYLSSSIYLSLSLIQSIIVPLVNNVGVDCRVTLSFFFFFSFSFKELSHGLLVEPLPPESRRASDTPHLFPRSPRIAGGAPAGASRGSGCVSSLPVSPRGGPAASAVAGSVPASPRESSGCSPSPAAPPSLSLEARKARFSWSSPSPHPHLPRPPLVEGVEVLTHVGTFWPVDMLNLNRQCEGNVSLREDKKEERVSDSLCWVRGNRKGTKETAVSMSVVTGEEGKMDVE